MKATLVGRTSFSLIIMIFCVEPLWFAIDARAVNGPNTVETNGFPWVVRLDFGSRGFGFLGSGSYITNGVVLTAAHNVNSADLVTAGGVTNSIGETFERATISGAQYYALGVQDPLYAGAVGDPNDIGLYLVLNAPGAPVGGFPILATTNDAPLTTGDTIAVLGFGKSTNNLPIYGTMTMTNPVVNVTYNNYVFRRPPSSEMTNPGDSGGPYIFNYGGTNKIVGVHTFGNTNTISGGTRVDNHYDFIIGNGQTNGAGASPSTLVKLGGAGNTSWSTAGSWLRSATNFNAIPQASDIAVLDPTTGSDTGTTVSVDVNTANLNGLLTDVTLNINGKSLNVTGASGALNGGRINVGGAAGSLLNIGASLDNVGTLNVSQDGLALIGGSLPGGYQTLNTALFNNSNATVSVTAGGTLAVTNINRRTQIINADASSVVTVVGGAAGEAKLIGDAFDNYGKLEIKDHALVDLNSIIWNDPTGQLLLSGGASGNATGDVFQLINWGVANISTGGVLVATRQVNNLASLTVAGGTVLTTNFALNFVTNFPANLKGTVAVSTTGRVVVSSGNVGVTNATTTAALRVNTGTFTMNGGNLSVDNLFVANGSDSQFELNGGVVTSGFTSVFNGRVFHVGSNAVAAALVLKGDFHTFSNGLSIAVTPDSTGAVVMAAQELNLSNATTVVGLRGNGQMVVSNGFTFSRDVIVGATNGAQGMLAVAGGTNLLTQGLSVGHSAAATGTVRVTGGLLSVSNDFTYVGRNGVGQMIVSNGTFLTRDMTVALANGARGSFAVDSGTATISQTFSVGAQSGATGSVLMTGGRLSVVATTIVFSVFIGDAGAGQMVVSNGVALLGGTVTTVANTNGSSGLLHVAGGTVTVNSLNVGSFSGATGSVLVTAGELVGTNGTTGIGLQGTGSLSVTGGVGRFSNIIAANTAGSDGTISVSGGTLSLSTFMVAGDGPNSKGAVWVTGGELAAADALVIISRNALGLMAVSNGTATVSNLTVASGFGGDGSLTVGGGTLTIRDSLHVSDHLVSTGTVLVTGGNMTVTNGSTLIGNLGSGRLTISNALVRMRDVTIAAKLGSAGTLTLNSGTLATAGLFNNTNGLIRGIGTIDGPVASAGMITPGFSAGKLFITTNLTLQSTSIIVMELGGIADAEFDQINMAGDLAANGTLTVQLINSFNPSFGDTFDIFDFANSSGQFSTTNLPSLFAGLYWDTSQLMTLGQLAVIPEASPVTLTLLGGAALALALRRRRTGARVVRP